MNYETVELKEKKVVGIASRTNNTSPEMTKVIGSLWNRFYEGGVYESIKNKCSASSLGIYSDYEGNHLNDYTITVGTEVSSIENLTNDCISMTIPSGKYAKFSIKTTMKNCAADIGAVWGQIWNLDLQRTFVADFEEYFMPQEDGTELVNIYIGLK